MTTNRPEFSRRRNATQLGAPVFRFGRVHLGASHAALARGLLGFHCCSSEVGASKGSDIGAATKRFGPEALIFCRATHGSILQRW
jgi:hypothetical protein